MMKKYMEMPAFKEKVKQKLKCGKTNEYALIYVDFDNFKYINELFGYECGDVVLEHVTQRLSTKLEDEDLFTKMYADNFVIFAKAKELNEFKKYILEIIDFKGNEICNYNLIASGGIYYIDDTTQRIPAMIDKANFARKLAKGYHISTVLHYSQEMDDELEWKKEITLNMEQALKNKEFEMYLQPKIYLKTGELTGAEALTRWNSKKNGMIFPDKFIPIFEQNGFIKLLDFYILEKACVFLNECIEKGMPILPISVNFSIVHLSDEDFVKKAFDTVKKHNIDTSLIEIELTERVFSQDFKMLLNVVDNLKNMGFKVSLDDFGSGYSSLNYLKNISLDTIKIDKNFLNGTDNLQKDKIVITKIVELIESLKFKTVIEGVENIAQLNFLKGLNCDIVQGFYYSKPVPVSEYEEFLKNYEIYHVDKEKEVQIEANNEELLYNDIEANELYIIGKNIDIGLVKVSLDENMTVQYVNDRALKYLGYSHSEFDEIVHNNISALFHPSDVELLKREAEQLKTSRNPMLFSTRALCRDGKIIALQGRASCIKDEMGGDIGIYAFREVTKELEKTKELEYSLRDKINELELLYESIPSGVIRCDIDRGNIYYINNGMLHMLGYTKEEITKLYDNKFINIICDTNNENVINQFKLNPDEKGHTQFEYMLKKKNGEIIWVLEQGQIIGQKSDKEQLCCVVINITEEKERIEALRQSEERYKIIIDRNNDIMFEWDFESDSIKFSDNYEEVLDISPVTTNVTTNQEIYKKIHPEDVNILKKWIAENYKSAEAHDAEFRFLGINDEYIWMKIRSTIICDKNGESVKSVGIFTNINNEKETVHYLKQKSKLDSLTKLYNKEETKMSIKEYIKNNKDLSGALIIIDIDNFKGVNDNLGHQFGDTVLLDVAYKTKDVFRNTDIIGRIGGDEFLVFMKDIPDISVVHEKCVEIIKILRATYYGERKKYNVSSSIGVSLFDTHGKTFEELYKYADLALYESKNNGKDCYTFYQNTMDASVFDGRKPIEAHQRFVTNYFAGDPVFNVFEMLYETKDIETTINRILKILGERFNVDSVYIFQFSENEKYLTNTYEWDAPNINYSKNSDVLVEDMKLFFNLYNSEYILCCNDTEVLQKYAHNLFDRQQIKSFLHCGLLNEGVLSGFMGFDDCKKSRIWQGEEIAYLSYISRILSIFLFKKQISKDLWQSYENHAEMLNNMPGYIYVIDPKNYETLFLNKPVLGVLGADIGGKCHKIAFNSDVPCENCPAKKINKDTNFAIEEIYSELLNSWVSSAASRLMWTEGREAVLICCTDIGKYKKNI